MSRQRHPLTPAVQQSILAYIRAGGFPHVAAEAAGVPREVFEHWLRRGAGPRPPAPYRALREAVRQAQAQARLGAEASVLSNKPLDWLRCGPGRHAPDSAGWTSPVKPPPAADKGPANPLLDSGVQAFIPLLLDALTPFPEARAATARVLAQLGLPLGTKPRR